MLAFQLLELLTSQARALRRYLFPEQVRAVLLGLQGVLLRPSTELCITDALQLGGCGWGRAAERGAAETRDAGLSRLHQDYELGKVGFPEFFAQVRRYFDSAAVGASAEEALAKLPHEQVGLPKLMQH